MQSEDVCRTGIRKNLNRLLRELTDDEQLDFESVPFQSFSSELAKNEDDCTETMIEVLFETTRRLGCQDRLLMLQLFNSFFTQFVQFRDRLLNDPQEFLELMLETNPIHNPLPGSKKLAKKLKSETISVIKGWENRFMKNDVRIKCIVVTLKKTKFVNYDGTSEDYEKEQLRKKMLEERKQQMLQNALSAYQNKFQQIKRASDKLVLELETILEILVPSFTEPCHSDFPSTSKTVSSDSNFDILIPSLSPEIVVSSENDALVEALLDAKLLLIHRVQTLRKLAKRLKVLKTKGEHLSQHIIDYRDGLKKLIFKTEELQLKGYKNPRKKKKKRFDDDFVDVEMSIDDILMIQYSKQTEEAVKLDVVVEEKLEDVKKEQRRELVKEVKRVPFGLDLKYWGEEREQVQVPKNNTDCHRFWRSADEGTSSGTAQQNIYTQRQFTFVGEAPKSDKVCRARLPNGSLCPRRDFSSCPLHGKIVSRDEKGNPIAEQDRLTDNLRNERKRKKEAEQFALEIEKEHGKKQKKRKHDVEMTASQETRNRLQRKLLDPKTVARVSAVLDASRKNRIEKNFGQQFSHL